MIDPNSQQPKHRFPGLIAGWLFATCFVVIFLGVLWSTLK